MYDDLSIGDGVIFDVRGERRGKITDIFEIDGVTYCSLMENLKAGFVEYHARVGLPRINVLTGRIPCPR